MIRPSGDGLASQRSGHNNVENLEAKRTYPARNARSAGEIVSLLAFVLDLYSRRVVGWGMSAKPDAELVIKALDRTYEMRGRPQDVLFHSDQGKWVSGFIRPLHYVSGCIRD